MSDCESEPIDLRHELSPNSPSPDPSWRSESCSSLRSLLTGSNYELVEAEDGSLSSVTSEDLEHDGFSDSPPLVYGSLPQPVLQSPDQEHISKETFEPIHSASSSPNNSFDESDFAQNSDSQSTLRLSYAFPDPTDNEIPVPSPHETLSPVLTSESPGDQMTSEPPHTPSDSVGIAITGPGEETHGQQQLYVYLLGSPISRSGERTLLNKLRADLAVDQLAPLVPLRKDHETLNWRERVSNYHPAIIQALSSPTYVPQQPARACQTTGRLNIILHDFTHLSEPLVRLRLESLPLTRPGLIIYHVDESLLLPHWLSSFLINRRLEAGGMLKLLMISTSDINPKLSNSGSIQNISSSTPEALSQFGDFADPDGEPMVVIHLNDLDKLNGQSINKLEELLIQKSSPSHRSTSTSLFKSILVSSIFSGFLGLLLGWFALHSGSSSTGRSPSVTFSSIAGSRSLDVLSLPKEEPLLFIEDSVSPKSLSTLATQEQNSHSVNDILTAKREKRDLFEEAKAKLSSSLAKSLESSPLLGFEQVPDNESFMSVLSSSSMSSLSSCSINNQSSSSTPLLLLPTHKKLSSSKHIVDTLNSNHHQRLSKISSKTRSSINNLVNERFLSHKCNSTINYLQMVKHKTRENVGVLKKKNSDLSVRLRRGMFNIRYRPKDCFKSFVDKTSDILMVVVDPDEMMMKTKSSLRRDLCLANVSGGKGQHHLDGHDIFVN